MKSLLHKYVKTPGSQIGYVEDVHKALTSDKALCVVRMFGDSLKLEFWEDDLVETKMIGRKETFLLGESKKDSCIVPQQNK